MGRYYQNFWDVVADWRYCESVFRTKSYRPEFKKSAEQRLEYLTKSLEALLENATKRELSIFKAYGVVADDKIPLPKIDGVKLHDAVLRATKKLDRLVRSAKILDFLSYRRFV